MNLALVCIISTEATKIVFISKKNAHYPKKLSTELFR